MKFYGQFKPSFQRAYAVGRHLLMAGMVLWFAGGARNAAAAQPDLPTQSGDSLIAKANNSGLSAGKRCRAICSLFRDFVKPGSGVADIHAAVGDATWLPGSGLQVMSGPGWVPVERGNNQTVFLITLFTKTKNASGEFLHPGYDIYFVLSGGANLTEADALAAFAGKGSADIHFIQCALCDPDEIIEQVTEKGIRPITVIGGWKAP